MSFSYISGHVLECVLTEDVYSKQSPEFKKHEITEFGVGKENSKGLKLDYQIQGSKMVMHYQVESDF